jgi:hypothetical protein
VKVLKKSFETEIWLNKKKVTLNNFVQEALANMLVGLMKTLKDADQTPRNIEMKIKKLPKPRDVNPHLST